MIRCYTLLMKNLFKNLFSISMANAHVNLRILGLKLKFKHPLANRLEICCCIPNMEHFKEQNPRVPHPIGIVIHPNAVIGKNCAIYQNVTIGSDGNPENVPTIGDNVILYANAIVFGKIKVGNNVKIGAGSVVTHDVPENAIVAGNPAKIIRYRNISDSTVTDTITD